MTIGLLCAIPQELQHLSHEIMKPRADVIAGSQFIQGELDGHDVVLVGAGIGKVNTAVAATILAERYKCRAIVFSGVAGGLSPDLKIGDVVIADRTFQHDAGVIEHQKLSAYQPGHVPFFNPTDSLGYKVPSDLITRIGNCLKGFTLPPMSDAAGGTGRAPVITFGTILSGDQYIHCEATRNRLGQVCEAFAIPYLDIRALSDLAGKESRFDFGAFVDEVAASSAAILRRILPQI